MKLNKYDLYLFLSKLIQSTSSGRTGCDKGITDFLFTSLEHAFLISGKEKEQLSKSYHIPIQDTKYYLYLP